MKSVYNLDKIIDSFEKYKEKISNDFSILQGYKDMMTLEEYESSYSYIIGNYLMESIQKHFESPEKFSENFKKKYVLHRILKGDYIYSQEPSELHKKAIMLKFNEELSSVIISDFSSGLFINRN